MGKFTSYKKKDKKFRQRYICYKTKNTRKEDRDILIALKRKTINEVDEISVVIKWKDQKGNREM